MAFIETVSTKIVRSGLVGRGVIAFVLALVTVVAPLAATEYFVAVDHPSASDSNLGRSADKPFKSLARAASTLVGGDILHIAPGVYREALIVEASGSAARPIVITGDSDAPGDVIIRGSDVVKGWTHDGGDVWSVPWQPLEPIAYPSNWPDYGEYSRRREMIFVDGDPLVQVVSRHELAEGRFWMDDAAGRMRIHISEDPNVNQVEISVRNHGILATGSHHVFRNLTVEHVTSEIWTAALHLGTHQRVENCSVVYNNGVGIKTYSNSVITKTESSFNGRLGIALNGSGSVLTSCQTNRNSWRYGPRWEAGGIKILGGLSSDNHIRGHRAIANNGIGIWFDTCGHDNLVDGAMVAGNVFGGIELEAAEGPNRLINNLVMGTRKAGPEGESAIDGAGIIVYDSSRVEIFNNTIVDTQGPGIAIGGGRRGSRLEPADITFVNNIIVGAGRAAVSFEWLSGPARRGPQIDSHTFDHNLYSSNPIIVIFPRTDTAYGLEFWSLAEWQHNRGQDLNSLDTSPGFLVSVQCPYTLDASSPAVDAGSGIDAVDHDFFGISRPQGPATDIGAFERVTPPTTPNDFTKRTPAALPGPCATGEHSYAKVPVTPGAVNVPE